MTNGAVAAKLDFVLRNSASGHKYQVETLPGGLGVIDFDGRSIGTGCTGIIATAPSAT